MVSPTDYKIGRQDQPGQTWSYRVCNVIHCSCLYDGWRWMSTTESSTL